MIGRDMDRGCGQQWMCTQTYQVWVHIHENEPKEYDSITLHPELKKDLANYWRKLWSQCPSSKAKNYYTCNMGKFPQVALKQQYKKIQKEKLKIV